MPAILDFTELCIAIFGRNKVVETIRRRPAKAGSKIFEFYPMPIIEAAGLCASMSRPKWEDNHEKDR